MEYLEVILGYIYVVYRILQCYQNVFWSLMDQATG